MGVSTLVCDPGDDVLRYLKKFRGGVDINGVSQVKEED